MAYYFVNYLSYYAIELAVRSWAVPPFLGLIILRKGGY